MKAHFKLLFSGKYRKRTSVLIGLALIAVSLSLILEIEDNPAGITVIYIGVMSLILSMTYIWSLKKAFLILALISAIGFPFFIVLHNIFFGIAELTTHIKLVSELTYFLDTVSFLIAMLICPPGVLVGLVGTLFLFIKERRSTPDVS